MLNIVLVSLSFVIIGYLFGNLSFGTLINYLNDNKLKQSGSKNIGATNVTRVFGKRWGILTLVLDASKSYVAIIVCWIIFRYSIFIWSDSNENLYCLIFLAGCGSVVGHCYPILFLIKLIKNKFDIELTKKYIGGKGVASTVGVVFAISPWLVLVGIGVFFTITFIFRYISLSSMCSLLIVSLLSLVSQLDYVYLFHSSFLYGSIKFDNTIIQRITLMCILLFNTIISVIRHKQNIVRLIKHEEKKFF